MICKRCTKKESGLKSNFCMSCKASKKVPKFNNLNRAVFSGDLYSTYTAKIFPIGGKSFLTGIAGI